nr:MAG TPA: hypothetical protein [Caudovirales sp. ctnYA4]
MLFVTYSWFYFVFSCCIIKANNDNFSFRNAVLYIVITREKVIKVLKIKGKYFFKE